MMRYLLPVVAIVALVGLAPAAPRPSPVPGGDRTGWPPRADWPRLRCDIAGIRLPAIAPFGRTDVLFSAIYPAYPPDVRADIRRAMKARGYTHLVFSLSGGYRGLYPTYDLYNRPEALRAILRETLDDGLMPVVFLLPDDLFLHRTAGGGLEPEKVSWPVARAAFERKLAPLLADRATLGLIRIAATGWEIDQWMTPDVMTESARWLRRVLGPEPLLFVHFGPGRVAACGTPGCEAGWWRDMVDSGTLSGIFYQDNHWEAAGLVRDLTRVAGHFARGDGGWPTRTPRGEPVYVEAFEYSAYRQTWDGKSEGWGNALGDAAMDVPGVFGFCDGGTKGTASTGDPGVRRK
ncbi:MAG TPA: hypothetical protein VND92_00075 [Vicinamibacterales bacterium]|nr:hypothetical protein [Vicinamibacterales bacterium]